MARMYPELVGLEERDNPKLRAEIVVYDCLEDQLDDDWHVFYGVQWTATFPGQRKTRDGEVDFVLAHPEWGIILMEVKGGLVTFVPESNTWYSVSQGNHENPIADPFRQVMICRSGMRGLFRDRLRTKKPVHLMRSVCFPDSTVQGSELPGHAPRALIIDGTDLDDLPAKLAEVSRFWNHVRSPGEGWVSFEDALRVLQEVHSANFQTRRSVGLLIRENTRVFQKLTEEQQATMDELEENPRLLVRGCAGSGKTLLAVAAAERLAEHHSRVLLVCFNDMLAADPTRRLRHQPRITVGAFHDVCLALGREAGLPIGEVPTRAEAQAEYFDSCPGWALTAVERHPALRFGAVVVDEGQDFEGHWWTVLRHALRDPQNSPFYVFYDDNQVLYTERSMALEHEFGAFMKRRLRTNLRNTASIHDESIGFYEGHGQLVARGPKGAPVEYLALEGMDDLSSVLAEVVLQLVEHEDVRPDQIMVLTLRGSTSTRLRNLRQLANLSFGEFSARRRTDLSWSTVRKFKGLESPVLILVEPDQDVLGSDRSKDMLYVAITRARSYLLVLATQDGIDRIKRLRSQTQRPLL